MDESLEKNLLFNTLVVSKTVKLTIILDYHDDRFIFLKNYYLSENYEIGYPVNLHLIASLSLLPATNLVCFRFFSFIHSIENHPTLHQSRQFRSSRSNRPHQSKYSKFYDAASEECCLFIVPRNKYLKFVTINESFITNHILKPSMLLKS